MSWDEIANIINKEFRTDESEYRSEAAYRKPYQQAKRYFEANVFKTYKDEDSYFKELQIQKDAIYKEKRKLYDQRREYNKLLISDARAEHLNDELIRIAENLNKEYPLVQLDEYKKVNTKKEALLALMHVSEIMAELIDKHALSGIHMTLPYVRSVFLN